MHFLNEHLQSPEFINWASRLIKGDWIHCSLIKLRSARLLKVAQLSSSCNVLLSMDAHLHARIVLRCYRPWESHVAEKSRKPQNWIISDAFPQKHCGWIMLDVKSTALYERLIAEWSYYSDWRVWRTIENPRGLWRRNVSCLSLLGLRSRLPPADSGCIVSRLITATKRMWKKINYTFYMSLSSFYSVMHLEPL